ncbi:MAG: hypothetical protein RXO43_01635 [Candidatus Micrarchaeota archaeon]
MAIMQKTLDDFKIHDNEALNLVSTIVRMDYLQILGELQKIKREVFSNLEKANLMKEGEQNTIKVSLPGYDVSLEKFMYSDTPITKAAKMKVDNRESLNKFREAIAQANEDIFKKLSEFGGKIPTTLYFGVLRRAAKVKDEKAINALSELQEKGLIQIEIRENIDTRNLDIDKLVKDVKHNNIVQEKIDLYADESYTLEYVSGLLKSYIKLWEERNEKENEIFSILQEFNLIGPGKSIKVTTDYGTVYIGAYENINYEKVDEEKIKDTLSNYGFREEEFTIIDLTKIMRSSEKYALLRKKLEEEKYISPKLEERIRIYIRNAIKEAKRKE